jgi:Histidine kinase
VTESAPSGETSGPLPTVSWRRSPHRAVDASCSRRETANSPPRSNSYLRSAGGCDCGWPLQATCNRCRHRGARARTILAGDDERRRLERDLHDGVQNEFVALIVKLSLAEQDPDTPPSLTAVLSALGSRAEAALDSVRQIARGIYPPLLADFGVLEALRAQASRAPMDANLDGGTVPRSSGEAKAGLYFSCLEAIQKVANTPGTTHTSRSDCTMKTASLRAHRRRPLRI